MRNPNAFIAKDGVSDAGLIFAARDMYAALADLAFPGPYEGQPTQKQRIDAARAALAKARGES
jgi:hypothetical protein